LLVVHRALAVPDPDRKSLEKICELLREATGHDDTRHVSRVSDQIAPNGTLVGVKRLRLTLFAFGPLLLAACGGLDPASAETMASVPTTQASVATAAPPTVDTPPTTRTPATNPPSTISEPEPVTWTAAKAEAPLEVFRAPGDATPFRTLDERTILGTETVALVIGGSDAWLEVMLPGRPNGETGWIRAIDVERYTVRRQAVVDLTTRTLQVLENDEVIFETAVGIGSPSAPTPVGTFFVTDAVRITDPTGPWGPYAFGLSARSDTVTEFNGGDGIIGIHGTNRPNSIGEAQSLGCVRLPNDVMMQLSELLSVGSPVTIKA
jgi:lipoprotein-anchoring transpeptidase ErfK/SrfK